MSDQAKYRRIVELGRGGMAVVTLTAMRSTHGVTKLVVVKELHEHLAAEPEMRAMFLDEARLAARLNHPNVVQTFEIVDHFGEAAEDGLEGACAIVMEYLEGQPLNRLRAPLKDDPRALAIYLNVLVEALSGIDYAHTLTDYQGAPLNIVHRDISPHNVFVTYAGEVKVLDFGIAKANDASSAPTQSGTVKGKLGYMAPEQARGDRVDARADVFACGVILWEAVVGRRLWAGMNEPGILYRLTQGMIPAPRDERPDVPERLDAICRRALAHDPAQRYPTAAALRDDLEAFVATLPEKTSRRALGDIVSSLFAEQRAEVRRVIEAELGRTVSTSQPVPKLPTPVESGSGIEKTTTGSTGITRATATTPIVSTDAPRSRTGLLLGVAGALLALATVATIAVVLLVRPGNDTHATAPSATTSASALPQPTETQAASSISAKPAEPKPSASAALAPKPTSRPTASSKPVQPKPSANPIDVGY